MTPFSLRFMILPLVLAAATAPAGSTPEAMIKLQLASPFGDHMVLQRDQPVRVWGMAPAGAVVGIALDGAGVAEAKSDATGSWKAMLPAMKAGGPHKLTISTAGASISHQDVLFGDVWLCSGQSNMQFQLKESVGGHETAAKVSQYPNLRLLLVPKAPAKDMTRSFTAEWSHGDEKAAGEFSAVALYFANALVEKSPALKDVPIGLIDSSFGGTRVEGWMPQETLAASFKPEDLHDSIFNIKPTQLYNGMIAPLAGLNLKGVLWYQGESNTAQAATYPAMLKTMITKWRTDFQSATLPFYIVQLPNYLEPWEGFGFEWMRDAQAKVAATTEGVAMAVTIDTPDGYDLHPRNKRLVGERLALLARQRSYGESIVASGPVFASASVEGSGMVVHFDTMGSSLVGRDDHLPGFAVAGSDGVYMAASGSITGPSTVRVQSELVKEPKTVRYAWEASPVASLYNKERLPAPPFRTDTKPQEPMCEVQLALPVRRVVTQKYSATIDGYGSLTSLQVDGQQMLSCDMTGGFILSSGWGPRKLLNCTEMGPQAVRFSDGASSVTYRFAVDRIVITVDNHSAEALPVRFAMADLVEQVGTFAPDTAAVFKRGQSVVSVAGVDDVARIFNIVYELKAEVAPKASRELQLTLSVTPPVAKP